MAPQSGIARVLQDLAEIKHNQFEHVKTNCMMKRPKKNKNLQAPLGYPQLENHAQRSQQQCWHQ